MRHAGAPDFRREGQVLLGTITGPVSLERLMAIRAEQCAEWVRQAPRATVLDYRAATFTLSSKQWDLAFAAALRWTYAQRHPTAMVVDGSQLGFFVIGAMRFARHGISQPAFTDPAHALAWAREHLPSPPPRVARS